MKPKQVATAVLLAFVGASVLVLVVKQLRQVPEDGQTATAGVVSGSEAGESNPGKRVIAYYFHGNIRCPTCNSIEQYAHEALETGFGKQLEDGQLEWRIVNFDEPENEHLALHYELAAPSLVLVMMDGATELKWKNLPEVWELVGNRPAFIQFVQKNAQAFLSELSGLSQVAGAAGAAHVPPIGGATGARPSDEKWR